MEKSVPKITMWRVDQSVDSPESLVWAIFILKHIKVKVQGHKALELMNMTWRSNLHTRFEDKVSYLHCGKHGRTWVQINKGTSEPLYNNFCAGNPNHAIYKRLTQKTIWDSISIPCCNNLSIYLSIHKAYTLNWVWLYAGISFKLI